MTPRLLILLALVGLAASQFGRTNSNSKYGSSSGSTKKGRDYDERLPDQRFIFPDRFVEEGPTFRSFSNKSCQLVCRGSLALRVQPAQTYFRYHRVNLTDCFNAPHYSPETYIFNSTNVTRMNAGPGVLLSRPEVYERQVFRYNNQYGTDEYYLEFGVFVPRQRVDGRVYVDWEVRRERDEEFGTRRERDACKRQIDWDRREAERQRQERRENKQMRMDGEDDDGSSWDNNRDRDQERDQERPMSEWWRLQDYTRMDGPIRRQTSWRQSQDGQEGEFTDRQDRGNFGYRFENYMRRNRFDSRDRYYEDERRMFERFERIINRGWY